MGNGYFPGKKKPATRGAIITPPTGQELQIAAMPRMSREARQALRDAQPLRVGGADLVEGADRIMRTPAEHQAAGVQIKGAPPSSHDPATVAFELSGAEAWALAQFVVRVGWEIPETPSNQELREALAKLQQALRDQGYAPR